LVRIREKVAILRDRHFFMRLLPGLAVAAAIWWGLGGAERERPDVLVVTVDTLRADALADPGTHAFRGLAARGTRFAKARTVAPLTLPAHISLFTGLAPCDHGVRDNTAAPLPPRGRRSYTLLAEEFADAGYATAAFVAAGVLHARYGIDAGFSTYRSPPDPSPGDPRFPCLDGEEQVERLRRFLDDRPAGRPWFAWVHLWEPHEPYESWAGDDRRDGTEDSDPPAERYRGEVRRSDALLERILSLVDPERTLVIVTSDHGESLGEHDEPSHGVLCYGATMDIPLLVAGPGIPAGREVETPCSLLDVAPTVRRLCRLATRETGGADLFSLPSGRILCGESLYGHRLYTWAQQSVATDGRFTLIDGGARLELFDRSIDPGELTPLPEPLSHPSYEAFDRALGAYRARGPRASEGAETAAPESPYGSVRRPEREYLRPAENRLLPDARERLPRTMPVLQAMAVAIAARDRAMVARLMDALERIEAEELGNPAPSLERGRALLLVLGDGGGAVGALEEAIRRGYRSPDLDRLLEAAREKSGR